MNQKRILIVVNSFSIGGTMASLKSLLSVINPADVKIDVFARSHTGEWIHSMPNCTVLPENVWLSHSTHEIGWMARMVTKLLWVLRKVGELVGIDMYQLYGKIGGRQIGSEGYDAVIGYDEMLARVICSYPAQRRINWIHCDYRRFANGKDESCYYDKIDRVVCVSDFVKGVFCDIYPKYADKTVAIHNVINSGELMRLSQEPANDARFDNAAFTIVSCGRLDPVKQFSLIPEIADGVRKLTNVQFMWYIVGGGDNRERMAIEQAIIKFKVEDCVIPLGSKANPYPYMSKANLYVCTSSSESFPMVVNEAKALGIYVVSNEFPSVRESIRNVNEGVICPIQSMAEVIARRMECGAHSESIEPVNENDIIVKQFMNLFTD